MQRHGSLCFSCSSSASMALHSYPAENTDRTPEFSRQGWWEGAESCGRPHKRSGQHTCRKGKTVGQDNRQRPHWNTSPCSSQRCTVASVMRSRANGGREESKLRNQRRSVEGSAIRSGSLTVGGAFSQEQSSSQ